MNDIQVIRKTATGPVSGTVHEAIWTKPDGEKVRSACVLQLQLFGDNLFHALEF